MTGQATGEGAQRTRLGRKYYAETRAALVEKLGLSSIMATPAIEKVVLNMGVGAGAQDRKKVDAARDDMERIAGQRPIITYARKSEASFRLREGAPVGVKVTLRGARMYEFLDRLINIALPSVRDFRGLALRGFDGRGNYSLGLREHIVFPEIDYDKVEMIRGMDIAVATTAKDNAAGQALLESFNFPFIKEQD